MPLQLLALHSSASQKPWKDECQGFHARNCGSGHSDSLGAALWGGLVAVPIHVR